LASITSSTSKVKRSKLKIASGPKPGVPLHWSSNVAEEMQEYCLKNEKFFFENMMFHNTEKTGTRHGNVPQTFLGARTSTPK